MKPPTLRLQLALDSPAREFAIIGKTDWRLLAHEEAIEIKPLVDYDGEPVSEIPIFDRAEIFPVPPDPDLTLKFPKEAQAHIEKCIAEAKTQGRRPPSPQRLKAWANAELRRVSGYPSEYPRGWLTAMDILPLVARHHGQEGRDLLQRIRYRAEFWHGADSLGMYLSACGEDVLTVDEQRIVLARQQATATRELRIFRDGGAAPRRFAVWRTASDYDYARWKRYEAVTPNSVASESMPKVEWRFISATDTVRVEPLADTAGLRVCVIPPFGRIEIHPAEFGYPPGLLSEHHEEAERKFRAAEEQSRSEGSPLPDRDTWNQIIGLPDLWTRYGTPELRNRWLQSRNGTGYKLFMGHHYQGGIHGRDLKRIKWRADFFAEGAAAPRSIFLASCEPCCPSDTDAVTLGLVAVQANSPALSPTSKEPREKVKKRRHKVFSAEFTTATLSGRNGKLRYFELEPEQTKLVKRIYDEPGHRIARTKLIAAKVAGTQPEKAFKRGVLKVLWRARVIGKEPSGRRTSYWVKPYLDM